MIVQPPGSVIGILGDGQLGRMLAIAAAQLGYRCYVYAPLAPGVAGEVAYHCTAAAYDDGDALAVFARHCTVITYEFENIPVRPLDALAPVPVYPPAIALDIAQDRVSEKNFCIAHGGVPARHVVVNGRADIDTAIAELGLPLILKTRRMGYDGKGQVRIDAPDSDVLSDMLSDVLPDMLDAAWDAIGAQPAIAEAYVPHDGEFSVILVRGGDGAIAFWDSTENTHMGGILAKCSWPMRDSMLAQVDAARTLAADMAAALGYVGVMTCEFFATDDGPVFNEMAPRVHNSGHWTIEGAVTSQFENHIRAICGLPLGSTATRGSRVDMANLIGEEADTWPTLLSDPDCHFHLYGKGRPVEGRKMGHATWVS